MEPNTKGRSVYESRITKVAKNLFIGSAPPVGDVLKQMGFDELWLCAEEYQPDTKEFEGVQVHHFPNQDLGQKITDATVKKVKNEAAKVAQALKEGKKVLVTCRMGWVRSAALIIAAMKLMNPSMDLDDEIARLREKRDPMVLNSANWVGALHRMFPGGKSVEDVK
jgi:protein-tyrosine phosphatase